MFGIVIVARGEGIKATGKSVNGRVEVEVVIVRKDDVEVSVELSRGELVEVARDESKAYQIALGALDSMTNK